MKDKYAKLIRETDVMIWDEAPMGHKYILVKSFYPCYSFNLILFQDCLARNFKEVRNIDEPMGGMIFVMSGDFKQVLPIVKGASPRQIVKSSLKHSKLWREVIFTTFIKKTFQLRDAFNILL